MKNLIQTFKLTTFCLCFLLSFSLFSQNHQQIENVKGSWVGKLKVQGIELKLVINISANEKDSIIATFNSPDQGALGIPTSKVILTDDSLIVKVKSIGGVYIGQFNAGFSELKGTWKQSGVSFPLDLIHQDKPIEAKRRPQEPQPPFPYSQKEVVFKNYSAGGIELAGTLTMPKEGGTFPVVVLITGSGPQNRDEELLGHKPFFVLADYLTHHGIAVLRYDDRGVGKSGGKFSLATTHDFATDASAAVDFLKTLPNIDTSKIGLIGHSEGGIIAPIVASERKDIAFIVLMAGPGLPGEKIILAQTALISRASGVDEKDISETISLDEKAFKILRKNSNIEVSSAKIRKMLTDLEKKQKREKTDTTKGESTIESQVKSLTSPWFMYFLFFDPMTVLTKVKCPLLAINGEKDMQVPPKENLEAIEKAMIMGGNSKYTIEMIPGVNHLFQTAPTGNPSEYAKIEETMAPFVLDRISGWIIKTLK